MGGIKHIALAVLCTVFVCDMVRSQGYLGGRGAFISRHPKSANTANNVNTVRKEPVNTVVRPQVQVRRQPVQFISADLLADMPDMPLGLPLGGLGQLGGGTIFVGDMPSYDRHIITRSGQIIKMDNSDYMALRQLSNALNGRSGVGALTSPLNAISSPLNTIIAPQFNPSVVPASNTVGAPRTNTFVGGPFGPDRTIQTRRGAIHVDGTDVVFDRRF